MARLSLRQHGFLVLYTADDWRSICLHVCFERLFLTGPLRNTDNFVFVSDLSFNHLYQVDVATGAMAQLLPIGRQPRGLAYDSTAKLLYWSDIGNRRCTINRYSLLTNSSNLIFRDRALDCMYLLFVQH